MPNAKVIDLSHHNTVPQSLKPAAEHGVLGVIHKCTEGTRFYDGKARARKLLAAQASLMWGIYHFLRPGSVEKQVEWFLANARRDGLLDSGTLVALDHEDPDVTADAALEFLQLVEHETGRSPVLYSGDVIKRQGGAISTPELHGYRLWLAQYAARPILPPGYDDCWLWQWTEKGSVPGITPPTDLNHWAGLDSTLAMEWAGVEDEGNVVTVTVKAPAGVRVKVVRESY